MLDWHTCQICYPLEIKLLLLLYTEFAKLLEDMPGVLYRNFNPLMLSKSKI